MLLFCSSFAVFVFMDASKWFGDARLLGRKLFKEYCIRVLRCIENVFASLCVVQFFEYK